MEQYQQPSLEEFPDEIEQRFDVDAQILYQDGRPFAIWFRYMDESRSVVEHTIPIDDSFDVNCIYGGLMSWIGYFTSVTDSKNLIAVQLDGQRYDLNNL